MPPVRQLPRDVSRPPSTAEEQDARVSKLLHTDGWWWKVLWLAKPWRFVTPWPAEWILRPSGAKRQESRDSVWMTVAIVTTYLLWSSVGTDVDGTRFERRAGEWSRQLFTGAFLLGTLLSVSNALPGQTVLKAVVRRTPDYILKFAVPYAWAVTTGLAGAVLLFFYSSLSVWQRQLAVFVGIYGGLMEINALVFSFRMFLLGLIKVGRDERKSHP